MIIEFFTINILCFNFNIFINFVLLAIYLLITLNTEFLQRFKYYDFFIIIEKKSVIKKWAKIILKIMMIMRMRMLS